MSQLKDKLISWCFIEVDHSEDRSIFNDDRSDIMPDFLVCAAFVGLRDPLKLEFTLDDILTFPFERASVVGKLLATNFRTAAIDKRDYSWIARYWKEEGEKLKKTIPGYVTPELIWLDRDDDPRRRIDQVINNNDLIYSDHIAKDRNLLALTQDKNSIVPSTIAGAIQLAERFAPSVVANYQTEEKLKGEPAIWQGLTRQQRPDSIRSRMKDDQIIHSIRE